MPPTGHRQGPPRTLPPHASAGRGGLLLFVGLAMVLALIAVSVAMRASMPRLASKTASTDEQPAAVSPHKPTEVVRASTPPEVARGVSASKSRDEWLAELEARTIRAPKTGDEEAPSRQRAGLAASPAKSEEDLQVELAKSIYQSVLEPVAPDLRQLAAVHARYEAVCTGVTLVEGQTEGTWAEGSQAVVGRSRNGSISVVGMMQTKVWVPPRSTTSTIRKGDAPECQAMSLEAGQLIQVIKAARERADRVAVEKGVWTRIRSQVEEQVLVSLWRQ